MEKLFKKYKIFYSAYYLRAFIAILALGYLISIKNFLAGKRFVFHDNLPHLSDLIISQSGRNFVLPQLRSLHQTQAIPTWQNSELRVGFDPFSTIFFTTLKNFDFDILQVEAWRISIIYLFFVLSVVWIGKFLELNQSSQLMLVFMLLFSPFTQSIWGQGAGFLLPFKFVPITILFFLKWYKNWRPIDFVVAFIFLGLVAQGYQAIYALFVLAVICIAFSSKDNRQAISVFCFQHKFLVLLSLGWLVVSFLPFLVAYQETVSKFVSLPRIIMPFTYNQSRPSIFELLNPGSVDVWHGSMWTGYTSYFILGSFVILVSFQYFCRSRREAKFSKDIKVFWRLLLVIALFYFIAVTPNSQLTALSPGDHFLGLRNWGFLASIFNSGSAMLAALALNLVLKSYRSSWHPIFQKFFFVLLTFFICLDVISSQPKKIEDTSIEFVNPANIKVKYITSDLDSKSYIPNPQREFLFDPVKYFPIVHEGSAIWGIPSFNFRQNFDEYEGWAQKPTTTVTHSFEYLDFYHSNEVGLYQDAQTWKHSRFSKPFYIVRLPRCVLNSDYKDIGKQEKYLVNFDLIKVTEKVPKLCTEKKTSNHLEDFLSVKQVNSELKEVSYSSKEGMIAVFNENYDSHLTAKGKKNVKYQVTSANWRSTAVFLPPGSDTIIISYNPAWFVGVSYLRVVTFLIMVGVVIQTFLYGGKRKRIK